MASNYFSVDDRVSIDGKGRGIVTEIVFRGFDTFYMVKFVGLTDFEVELSRDRLVIVTEHTTDHHNSEQTTVKLIKLSL